MDLGDEEPDTELETTQRSTGSSIAQEGK